MTERMDIWKGVGSVVNLLWKSNLGTKGLLPTPFKTEEDFEKMVFDTQEILEDIFLIKRQIKGGNKPGIPDIVGLDNDGNICIVEMKNVTVDASIIPQVLQYAFWAETNPDSIKALWLECENKPDDLPTSWDSFQVRIVVIAPTILRSTLDIVNKIDYPVDLIEIKRWVEGGNQFLLVNKLEQEKKGRMVTPVTGIEQYDEDYYMKEYNKNAAKEFLRIIQEVNVIIKEKGWPLETKYNKHYCGFKIGFFNAFGIKWFGAKTFGFFFKIAKNQAESVPLPMTRYDQQWKEAVYYIEPDKTKTEDFIPLFEISFKKLTGK